MQLFSHFRRKNQKAKDCLEDAEIIYKKFSQEVGSAPHMMDEIFSQSSQEESDLFKKRSSHFEDTYTHTMYYLAQVYGRLEEKEKSAEYCHITLQRQLDSMTYKPLEWALNAATLSQYYISENIFPMARHCLAAAQFILREAGEPQPLTPEDEEGTQESDKEKLVRAHADMKRCWSKYGLALLEASWERLMAETVNEDSQNNEDDSKSPFKFNLELTAIESQITDQWVQTVDDAKAVFLAVTRWLNDSKQYYVIDGHCTDYVEIIQDNSKAYKLLANFDPDFERQCKMHKRRIDMVDAVRKELNPQHYMLICRQLIFELAETYSAMLDLKLAIIEESGDPPNAHAINKINMLATNSIQQYQAYLKTLQTAQKKLPERFASDDERPALVAHFCVGRLYSKFLQFDTAQRLRNLNMSLQFYKFIVDYCKKNPEAVEIVKNERDICEEMVTLLPAKMDRIRAQVDTF